MTRIVAGGVLLIDEPPIDPDDDLAEAWLVVEDDDEAETNDLPRISAACVPWLELDSGVCVTTGFDEVLGCTLSAQLDDAALDEVREFIGGSGWWLVVQQALARHGVTAGRSEILTSLTELVPNAAIASSARRETGEPN